MRLRRRFTGHGLRLRELALPHAAIVSRGRLWLAVGFLGVVAGAFLVSGTLDRVRPMLEAPGSVSEEQAELAGTPFLDMPQPPNSPPLSRQERIVEA